VLCCLECEELLLVHIKELIPVATHKIVPLAVGGPALSASGFTPSQLLPWSSFRLAPRRLGTDAAGSTNSIWSIPGWEAVLWLTTSRHRKPPVGRTQVRRLMLIMRIESLGLYVHFLRNSSTFDTLKALMSVLIVNSSILGCGVFMMVSSKQKGLPMKASPF
jgi:hypothetical protein